MPRREWGSGSCYRVGNRWRVAISQGSDPFGRRARKAWQFRSQAAAEAKLRDVTRRLDRGLSPEGERVTLGAYAPRWLASLDPNLRPSTVSFYGTMVASHLTLIGHHRVDRITPAIVRALIERMQSEGYASRTVLGVVDVLRKVLRMAERDGIVERNAAELVDRPKLVQKEPAHFTAEQTRRFLEVARDDPLFSLFVVALGTGLRRGELLALTRDDVDLDARVIHVRQSKTDAGVRTVPLPPFAAAALRARPRATGPIWPVDPTAVTRRVAAICERAGLPRLTTHGLRHTANTLMAEAGVPVEVRRRIMGHSRAEMNYRYTHLDLALARDAVEQLGRAVG